MMRDRVDLVIQCALLIAGREDDLRDRELGPIHLVKYVYLADLAYAERHDGKTFTEAAWEFHHFGPWDGNVFARLDPALEEIDASAKTFAGNYDSDFKRWSKTDDRLFHEIEGKLPGDVVSALRRYVHKFGRDTEELLHFVYTTQPMLDAAPRERLVFEPSAAPASTPAPSSAVVESRRAEKKREARCAIVKAQLEEKMKKKMAERASIKLAPAPRYDDVFFDGLKWLDELAGEPLDNVRGELVVDDEVWKSSGRRERRG